ncbi:MAG: O-antigen ligase family protein [Acidobacteriota bacterium]|nr:O-antigen ligase family protein [Acidobacteriota bacterium]
MISAGFIGLILFTALAHGAVEPWSELVFVLWTAVLALLWVVKVVRERKLMVFVPQTVWPMAALILLGVAQSFAAKNQDGFWHSLSLDVEATRGTVLLMCCLLLCSLIAANFMTHRERLQRLAFFLTIFGVLLSAFALIQYFTWNDKFYWFRAAHTETAFGPFVNRNHYAGYMELLLPWPVILMLSQRRREEKLFYGFAAAFMAMSAIFSLSRGGMISVFTELMFLAAFSPRGDRDYSTDYTGNRRFGAFLLRFGAVAAIIAAAIGGLNWLGAERVVNRLAPEQQNVQTVSTQSENPWPANTWPANSWDDRGELWRDSWSVFRANPLTGVGLGAFETAFPAYDRTSNVGRIVTPQTHNDYLQALTDGGLIGGLIALWFLIVCARAVWRGLRLAEPLMRLTVLACSAGMFGLLVHSLFDFNLQLPSHALLFLSFSAITVQLSELAEVLAGVRNRARPIADAKKILLTGRKQEV